jgi:hypothetical protein
MYIFGHPTCCNSPNQRSNTLEDSSCASSSLKPKKQKKTNAGTNYLKQPKFKNEEEKKKMHLKNFQKLKFPHSFQRSILHVAHTL